MLLRVLKRRGTIGVTTPGLKADPYEARVPANVQSLYGYQVGAGHTPEWWRRHRELSGLLEDVEASWLPDGRENWILWARAVREVKGTEEGPVLEMLQEADGEIGFVSVIARKRSPTDTD